jgi:zinc transport system ATP-binding protein
MAAILETKDLSVAFDGQPVLSGVTLSLEKGEALAIIGPNGAGKSVFLRAILGMVPHSGTVTWAADAKLGYVPQKIDADRHLPITFRNLLVAKAAVQKLPRTALDDIRSVVKFDDRIFDTPVGHLSGGQFQRGLIAFALLGKPNVLLLDEPIASIDRPGEEQFYELSHRLQDEFGMTIILVSHDLGFAYRYATKALCINGGMMRFGTPEEAFTPDALDALYGPHKCIHYQYQDEHVGN